MDTPHDTDALDALDAAIAQVRTVVVGQTRAVERLVACLLAGGHALLEGVPGVGKTVTIDSLARAVGGTFNRIQFTADLMPSDIVGTRIYQPSTESFSVQPGPVFANFVLADEVNRAPAKVQSALLEVMAERQVTLGGQTMALPRPHLVLATQNPIDSEGTYPLPEAQRDRFTMRIMIDYPTAQEEWQIMHLHAGAAPKVSAVATIEQLAELQDRAAAIPVEPPVARYALDLVLATRDPAAYGLPELADHLAYGASPRATLALVRAARGLALLRRRPSVSAQEIYDIAYDVLNHRLVLSYRALTDGVDVDTVLTRLLSSVKAAPSAAPSTWQPHNGVPVHPGPIGPQTSPLPDQSGGHTFGPVSPRGH